MFPVVTKPSSNRAHCRDSTISQDCEGVADHALIDTSLDPSFVSCFSSPQLPWSKAGNRPIVVELLIVLCISNGGGEEKSILRCIVIHVDNSESIQQCPIIDNQNFKTM